MALQACDNVKWGGMSIELRQSDPPPGARVDTIPTDPEVVLPPLPEGPVLSVVETDESGAARLVVVAEIVGDSVRPLLQETDAPGFTERFVQERLSAGTEFHLLANGVRVGRFTVEGPAQRDQAFCDDNLVAPGYVELHPTARSRTRFLALPDDASAHVPRGTVSELPSNRGQRVNALRIYGDLLNQFRARWPDDTQAARRDLRIIDLGGDASPTMASTFLFRDRLSVSEPGNSAHSIFFIATLEGPAYQPRYVRYRSVVDGGKAVPRYLDYADLDADGAQEHVLYVYGATEQWFAVVNPGADRWELAFEDPCGRAQEAAAPS